jgi:HD-like signal output (HDOD) protein
MRIAAKSITIPAQPKTVIELMKLCGNPNADLSLVARTASKDPSLTARILKVANAPAFGLRRKVESVQQAVQLMGLQIFQRAILAAALREACVQEDSEASQTFWTHSELTARCCEIIAKRLRSGLTEHAYLTGLFHDCAIPLLMQRLPDYGKVFRLALHYGRAIVDVEERRYSTSHCVTGYLFARSWQLPEELRLAILHHHDEQPDYSLPVETRDLLAILKVSEYIVQNYDTSGNTRTLEPAEWIDRYASKLDGLALEVDQIADFEEELLDSINQ